MKKPVTIHPLLLAAFPVIFLFAHNVEEVPPHQVLAPAAVALGTALLLLLSLHLVLRDITKTAIILSGLIILFFSWGRVFDSVEGWRVGGFVIGRENYLLIFWGLLFACLVYFVLRSRRALGNLTRVLNTVSLFLVAISLFNVAVYKLETRGIWEAINSDVMETRSSARAGVNLAELPDIYYIILDSYPSESTLKEVYGYDNRDFIDYLAGRGFFVASTSRSNYALTFLSLSSSLNMEYVNYLSDIAGVDTKDPTIPYQMIKNSKAMKFLRAKGYKFLHFRSGWSGTDRNQYADVEIQYGRGNEFAIMLVRTTALRPFETRLGIIRRDARGRILSIFAKLAEVHKIKEPTFAFVHMVPPHPPYFFGANGERVKRTKPEMQGDVWKQKQNYINQLVFVNKKVRVLVDEILSNSDVPPIIIIQGDHGTASTFEPGSSANPTVAMLKERMRILNAYYLPEGGKNFFYEEITPVNSFRLIFNTYFGADFEFLDDQSYYSTYTHPYRFSNVSEKVRYD